MAIARWIPFISRNSAPVVEPQFSTQEQDQSNMERRLVLRVLKAWRSASEDRYFPPIEAITEQTMGDDVWPTCFILELKQFRDDPLIRYCGDSFTHPPGHMVEMTKVSALPRRTLLAHSVSFLGEVLERGVPIARGGGYSNNAEVQIRFRSILLPLKNKKSLITHLLGAANSTLTDS